MLPSILKPFPLLFASVASMLLVNEVAAAPVYNVVSTGTPGNGYYAITGTGQIAGTDAANHAALLNPGGTNVDLGTLPGANFSFANAINASSQVVGESDFQSTNTYPFNSTVSHATLFVQGGPNIDLGGIYSANGSAGAYGINNQGQIVGFGTTSSGSTTAMLFKGNGMTVDLGSLGGLYGVARSINDASQIVGTSSLAGYAAQHATLFSLSGPNVDLGTLGGTYSEAAAVSNTGFIVGISGLASVFTDHAAQFVVGGTPIDLGTLGGAYSSANGVNDQDWIVGQSSDGAGNYDGFLWMDGTMLDLNTLVAPGSGLSIEDAYDINDAGQITALECTANNQSCNVVRLDPLVAQTSGVPEPGTLWLAMAASLALFVAPRRRKGNGNESSSLRRSSLTTTTRNEEFVTRLCGPLSNYFGTSAILRLSRFADQFRFLPDGGSDVPRPAEDSAPAHHEAALAFNGPA